MQTLTIGKLRTSRLGVGCWTFGRQLAYPAVERIVKTALDQGVTFFDTADRYGSAATSYVSGAAVQQGKGKSEEFLGLALGTARARVLIATKFGAGRGSGHRLPNGERRNVGGGRPEYVRECIESSLSRLKTDYIDLVQMHEPDQATPLADTLGELERLISAGKVREIGCSNFTPEQLAAAHQLSLAGPSAPFVTIQNHYSVLHRQPEPELIELCAKLGVRLIPYFPLESGVLTGKYRARDIPANSRIGQLAREGRLDKVERFLNPRTLALVERLDEFARARGRSILELALSWLASNPVVGPLIPGATDPNQVLANAGAINWSLSPEEVSAIDELCGHGSAGPGDKAAPHVTGSAVPT